MRMPHLSLALLFIVSIFNYTDRYMIAVLLPSIKRDFQLSDTQMGFLTGVAFTIFYVVAGIPIARIADKYSRRKLLSLALAVWSVTTAACGLAQNFVQLAIMRTLVGIGEAGSSPPCYSLISDLYPSKQRATAMAIYLAGAPAGILIGFILGGWLTELYGWRVALVAVGMPGLLFAFVLAKLLKDPPRGQMDTTQESVRPVRFMSGLMALLGKPTFWHTALGTAFYNALIVAYVNWLPSFYVRSHGLGIARTGLLLALVMGPSQLIGVVVGGSIADRLGKRNARWYLNFPAAVILLAAPLFMLSLLLASTQLALICLFVPLFIGVMQTSPPFAVTHSLVDARMRAVASAVLILIINIVSGGLGPIAVGFISDLLQPTFGTQSLRYALLLVTPTFSIWASLHFFLAGRRIHADLGVKQNMAPEIAAGAS
jgi:predicted MFS family arabinose efflux permease